MNNKELCLNEIKKGNYISFRSKSDYLSFIKYLDSNGIRFGASSPEIVWDNNHNINTAIRADNGRLRYGNVNDLYYPQRRVIEYMGKKSNIKCW